MKVSIERTIHVEMDFWEALALRELLNGFFHHNINGLASFKAYALYNEDLDRMKDLSGKLNDTII